MDREIYKLIGDNEIIKSVKHILVYNVHADNILRLNIFSRDWEDKKVYFSKDIEHIYSLLDEVLHYPECDSDMLNMFCLAWEMARRNRQ